MANVRVVQRRHRPRFALEAVAELFFGNLDGDIASHPRVTGAVNFTHTASADGRENLVRTQAVTGREHSDLAQFTALPASPVFRLRQKILYYRAGDVCQTEVSALETVGQLGVVEAQQMQDGGVQIVHVHLVLGYVETQLIGFAHHYARLDPAPRQPHREGVGMMVAAVAAAL